MKRLLRINCIVLGPEYSRTFERVHWFVAEQRVETLTDWTLIYPAFYNEFIEWLSGLDGIQVQRTRDGGYVFWRSAHEGDEWSTQALENPQTQQMLRRKDHGK